ncbi:MAG: ActS/PrrB/RegB family redox-sensitive histidine kinase, partial [Pseudomonadota bacterium]
TVQLASLLFLTGGLQNPFSILFLVPVVVAAATLPMRHTLRLCLLVIVLSTALAFYHYPLPWYALKPFSQPTLYVAGIWAALVLGMGFTVTYVWRVARENRTLSEALAATELVLQREQHLTRLDGLAAAAAHELGTPLATIALTAKELSRDLPPGLQAEDARLIVEQAARCRTILAKLSSLDDEGDVIGWLKVSNLLAEVCEPHRDAGPRIQIDVAPGLEPLARRNAGVLYGLGNVIENAVDYANDLVRIDARWTQDAVTIVVRDDGPGFSHDVLRRIGEPYLGEPYRASGRRARGQSGLGLGFFIAKTLLERSGAEVSIRNAGGAVVTVVWPAAAFRMPEARSEAPGEPAMAQVAR